MSCSTGSCTCGCCTGLEPIVTENNRPGLPALVYRIGTYSEFFARMRAQIASPNLLATPPAEGDSWNISHLSTRSTDDPAIALLDAWAVTLDVLTFYQERIANEAYLRTATERQSILELAREIGYELDPGVAASTYLSFLIEDVIGTAPPVSIPQLPRTPSVATQGSATYNPGVVALTAGTQVQSVPPQGQQPQTFETFSDLQGRTSWNLILPRLSRFADYAITASGQLVLIDLRVNFSAGTSTSQLNGTNCYVLNPATPLIGATTTVNAAVVDHLYFTGLNTGLSVGDLLMFVGANVSGEIAVGFQHVYSITLDTTLGQTRVNFDSTPSADPGFSLKTFPMNAVPGTPLTLSQSNVDTYIMLATISETDLQALIRISGWDPAQLATMVNNGPELAAGEAMGIYSFSSKASFFGHNAPKWSSLPASTYQRSDPYPVSWDAIHGGAGPLIMQNSQSVPYPKSTAYLERTFAITPNSLGVLQDTGGRLTGVEILTTADQSLADYSLSGKATGVTFNPLGKSPVKLDVPTVALLTSGTGISFAVGSDDALYLLPDANAAVPAAPMMLMPGPFIYGFTAIANYPLPLQIFAIDSSGKLLQLSSYSSTGSSWLQPVTIGTGYRGVPSVSTAFQGTQYTNEIDIFVATNYNALDHYWYNGNASSQWQHEANLLSSNWAITPGGSPVHVKNGPSALEVFFVSESGILMHTAKSATGPWWASPQRVVASQVTPVMGTPSVSLYTPSHPTGQNQIDVFVHGTNGHLFHTWYNPSSVWTQMEDLGVPPNGVLLQGNPCLVETGPSALEVFSIGNDGNLYTKYWNGSWNGPNLIGGNGILTGSPSAVSRNNNEIQVYASASDGRVYLFHFQNAGWSVPIAVTGGLSYYTRNSSLLFDSQQQALAQPSITDAIPAGSLSIQLNGFLPGLTVGQAVALTGQRTSDEAAGVTSSEIVRLTDIQHHGGFTELQIASPGLQYSYVRNTLTLNANTVLATNGASIPVTEILGSGDATQPNQSFELSRTQLTYVPAATATGSQSTLTIRVNNIEWDEVPTLYGLGPSDRSYIIREADDGTVTVTFGDGIAGARLPSGQNNVSAQYRTGIGVAGNIAANTLSVLQSRPPGLRSVSNVVPATGGADPQVLADARTNAPRTVLTLDRIVSPSDYENFTATFAGIGKAKAVMLALQTVEFQVIHITIAGGGGASVTPTSDLFLQLQAAIDHVREAGPYVNILSYTPSLFNISAQLILDPTYIAANVLAAATSAITTYFSFANRGFAQPVYAAEAIAVLQGIDGVIAAELTLLQPVVHQPTDPAVMSVIFAAGAGIPANSNPTTVAAVFSEIMPAEMLLLNPVGLKLTEKKS